MTYLIATVKEKHKFDICFAIHDIVPPLKVVLVTREAIYEETVLFLILPHSLFHGLTKHKSEQHIQYFTIDENVVNEFKVCVKAFLIYKQLSSKSFL